MSEQGVETPTGTVTCDVNTATPRTVTISMPESVQEIRDPIVAKGKSLGWSSVTFVAEPWHESSQMVRRLVWFHPPGAFFRSVARGRFQCEVTIGDTKYFVSM